MFTRILVPTDFSEPSDAALEYARTLACTFGAGLRVLHVLENEFLRPVVADPHALETAALRRLQERLTDDDRRTLHAIPVVERSDEPADEVVSYGRTEDIDLIVMGTHGRRGMAHLLMGSVAEKVIRTAPCPVLTLSEAAARRTNANPMRILVPTDFSPASDAALGCARRLATRFGASLHLLHVLEDPPVGGTFGSEFYLADSPDMRTARLNDARDRLAHRMMPVDRSQVHATPEVIFGQSAQTIVDYAADGDVDVIVMGTHGRGGMAHLLMGSVAERVIRTAPCPVLTVRDLAEPVVVRTVETAAVGATA